MLFKRFTFGIVAGHSIMLGYETKSIYVKLEPRPQHVSKLIRLRYLPPEHEDAPFHIFYP